MRLSRSIDRAFYANVVLLMSFIQLSFGLTICLSYELLPNSDVIAKLVAWITIAIATVPLLIFLRRFGGHGILFGYCTFNIAPVWFLYLEGAISSHSGLQGELFTALDLKPEMRIHAYGVALVFQAMVGLFTLAFSKFVTHKSIVTNSRIEGLHISASGYALIACASFWIPLIVIGGTHSSLSSLWHSLVDGRSGGSSGTLLRTAGNGGTEALLQPLLWLWNLTPAFACLAITCIIVRKEKIRVSVALSTLFGVLVGFFTFLGGSRGMLMCVMAIPIMFWFVFGPRIGKAFIPITVAFFVLAIGIMEFQVRARGNLLSYIINPSSLSATTSDGRITTMDPTRSHRDNNLYFLCLIVTNSPKPYPFTGYNDLLAMLVNPIPRVIWPSKPVATGVYGDISYLPNVVRSGPSAPGTSSLSYSIVGEGYMAGGCWGLILVAPFYALVIAWFDMWNAVLRPTSLPAICILGFNSFNLLWGFRAAQALVTGSYAFLLMYFSFLALSSLYSFRKVGG